MVEVRVNGEVAPIVSQGVSRVADLVELIKSWIDPEHMITALQINGSDLQDADWAAGMNHFGETAVIEVETGTPLDYVNSRLAVAADVVRTCYNQFRDARKEFQAGNMRAGNQNLMKAVETLQAYFQWYGTLLELVPVTQRADYDLGNQVVEISDICKRICQQQLYQSWWALGETLEKELEPKLDKLEDHCRKFRAMVQ
jgi:hypothetical protein